MLVAEESEWSRRYYATRFSMALSCEERAKLMERAKLFRLLQDDVRQQSMDCYISQNRVNFVRWLIEHGRLTDDV